MTAVTDMDVIIFINGICNILKKIWEDPHEFSGL